jgi:hypothetical protein
VVEVQVREHDVGDVAELEAGGRDRLRQPPGAGLVREHRLELGVVFVAEPGVHEHQVAAALDQQAIRGHGNEIALVGGLLFVPQRLRHDPEHGAAVEAKTAVRDDVQDAGAELHAQKVYPMENRAR